MSVKLDNPFEQDVLDIERGHAEGHAQTQDEHFRDEIANPADVAAIQAANLRPKGFYVTDPENYRPTVFTEVSQDEDGTRTGTPGPRSMGVILARVSQTVKGEVFTSVVRIKISPETRHKAVWVNDTFDSFHPVKHDSATRMYSEAQAMHKAATGAYATRISALLQFLAETPFKVNCMVKDDGNLTPWQIAPVGKGRR